MNRAAAAKPNLNPVPRMQHVIQSFVAKKTFMGTVLVVKGDKTLIDQGYGFSDIEWNVPNVPASKFRVGSITKQFTAAGILLLEERGKLKVEDPVKKYLPDAPAAWGKITIFNLLTHTSGIPNFTSFPDYDSNQWKETTTKEVVARFINKRLEFPPSTNFNYSNSGYVLLGYLLEKISRQKYGKFLQRNIFTPLGMADTGVDDDAAILLNRAKGYTLTKHGMEHADYVSMTIPFSAGNLYSTTGDLLKWKRGLFNGKVISPASLRKMTTRFKKNYAFGLRVAKENGHRVIRHHGGINGFNTSLAYYPDDKLTVIVLSNLDGPAESEIAAALAKLALGMQVTLPSKRKTVKLSHKMLQQYVGNYKFTPTFSIKITLEDGHLMGQPTNQSKFRLFDESESRFFLKVVYAEVEFSRNPATHAVTRMTLNQNGMVLVGKKQ